jgi:hypothetical protein
MLNGKGGLNAAANFRGIPPGLRNPQTEFMMRGNPERVMGQLGQQARMNSAGPSFPTPAPRQLTMYEQMLKGRGQ